MNSINFTMIHMELKYILKKKNSYNVIRPIFNFKKSIPYGYNCSRKLIQFTQI